MAFVYESFSAASVQWTLDTFKILRCLLLGSFKKKIYLVMAKTASIIDFKSTPSRKAKRLNIYVCAEMFMYLYLFIRHIISLIQPYLEFCIPSCSYKAQLGAHVTAAFCYHGVGHIEL